MKYDVIIIGAGLGGLTAGAKLAKEGKKVLVIEQHNRPGGCATTFRRGNFTLEVGLHEMDGPSPQDMKTRIFKDLDITGNVEFLHVPEFFRFINDRYSVTIPHQPEIAAERLSSLFPEESAGIKSYFDQILNAGKKPAGETEKDISTGEFLDSIINDEDLKLILLGNLGYFHDDPYTLSLRYYSLAQGSYYRNGASYIKGGSQKLSGHLAEFIKAHNGEVLLNNIVTNIRITGDRATGVICRRKNEKGSEGVEVFADEIVANNPIQNVIEIISPEYAGILENEFKDNRPGASLLTVYLGFSKPLRELGHSYYSTAVYDSSVKSQADIRGNNGDDYSRRSFIFVDYSQIDSELAPEGRSVGAVCCIDYLRDWEILKKNDYYDKKEKAASSFIARLDKIIPGIRNVIEYYEVGTPATVKRYTLNPEGAVYGFAQNPGRKITENLKTPANLTIASAWGRTGGGFSGVIIGGYLSAVSILRKSRTHPSV